MMLDLLYEAVDQSRSRAVDPDHTHTSINPQISSLRSRSPTDSAGSPEYLH